MYHKKSTIHGLVYGLPPSKSKLTIEWSFRKDDCFTVRLHGMSWGVKTTCFKAPGVSLRGSGVPIGGVRILRVV